MPSGRNSDLSQKLAVAATVAAGAVGVGLGLYYLTRNDEESPDSTGQGTSKTKLEDMTALQLKELGIKLFASKKYPDKAEDSSKKLLGGGDKSSKDFAAVCTQNGATTMEGAGSPLREVVPDALSAVVKFRPTYGKAYLRRARTEVKLKKYRETLTGLINETHHTDANTSQQIGELLSQIVDVLCPQQQMKYVYENGRVKQIPSVRDEPVYAWLHKMTEHDPIRNDILGNAIGSGSYFDALNLVRDGHYSGVCEIAEMAANDITLPVDLRLKSMLLAARFHTYLNQRDKAHSLLSQFDTEFSQLLKSEQREQSALMRARATFQIEVARNRAEVESAIAHAVSLERSEVDFYTAAAFRLTQLNELETAREIIGRADFEPTTKSTLVLHMLDILAAVKDSDEESLHAGVLALEGYVNTLGPRMSYALSLLARIYSPSQNADDAKEALDELLVMEPNEIIHLFDWSMLVSSEEDVNSYLSRCIPLKSNQTETNLVLASYQVNKIGTRALNESRQQRCFKPKLRSFWMTTPYSAFLQQTRIPIIDQGRSRNIKVEAIVKEILYLRKYR